jgi:hypothetical protein
MHDSSKGLNYAVRFCYCGLTFFTNCLGCREVALQGKSHNKIIDGIRCERVQRSSLWRYFHDGGIDSFTYYGVPLKVNFFLLQFCSKVEPGCRRSRAKGPNFNYSCYSAPSWATLPDTFPLVFTPPPNWPPERLQKRRQSIFRSWYFWLFSKFYHLKVRIIDIFCFSCLTVICRAFLKPRCKIAWAACYSSALLEPKATQAKETISETSSPDTASPDTAPLFVIDTAFDFRLQENLSTTGRYDEKDLEDQFSYTQTQRISAQQAIRSTSLSDLHQKVNFCVNSIWLLTIFWYP